MENFIRLSAVASSLARTQRIPPTICIQSRQFSISSSHQKGHSHAQNVAKNKKEGEDKKNAKISAYAKRLNDVVKGGFDPKLNTKLAELISVS